MNSKNFSRYFLSILDKNSRLVPFHWNKIQEDFDKNKTGKDIILKSRQIGFTTVIQAIIFEKLVTETTRAITLAHIDTSTQLIRQISDRFYNNFPDNIIEFSKPIRKYDNDTLTTYLDTDSTHFIGTAGNVNIGRGGTFSIFHGSEVAFWKDAQSIINGAVQAGNPDIILESTPNGAQGYFYDLCMESLSGKGKWKLHFYPWYKFEDYKIDNGEVIELTQEEQEVSRKYNLSIPQVRWRRDKMQELKNFFYQEYPEDVIDCFLTSNGGYFGDINLKETFTAPFNPVNNPNSIYTGGIDFGQANDYTCMIVIDRKAREQVDYLHINKMEWAEQRRKIKNLYNKWKLKGLRVEKNSIGSVNIEELISDGVELEPFDTTNKSKSNIFANLHEELETGLKLLNWEILRAELTNIDSTQLPSGLWRIAARNGHDDTVIALALALSARIDNVKKIRVW